jgi:hypothetical protein
VIGVHYGEFNIGFDINNVREAAQRFQAAVAGIRPIKKARRGRRITRMAGPSGTSSIRKGNIVMKVSSAKAMISRWRRRFANCSPPAHPEVMKLALDQAEDEFKPECGNRRRRLYVGEIYGRSSVAEHEWTSRRRRG